MRSLCVGGRRNCENEERNTSRKTIPQSSFFITELRPENGTAVRAVQCLGGQKRFTATMQRRERVGFVGAGFVNLHIHFMMCFYMPEKPLRLSVKLVMFLLEP